jgi:hypothetical protein
MSKHTAREYAMRLNSFRRFVLAYYDRSITIDNLINKIQERFENPYNVINFIIHYPMMSLLNDASRRTLEKIIDIYIEAIPPWIPDYRKEEVRKTWMYDKPEDFVLGLTIGMIYAYFEGAFLKEQQRQINPQERADVMTVISLRIPQIREALFKSE